jgi:MORN repeat
MVNMSAMTFAILTLHRQSPDNTNCRNNGAIYSGEVLDSLRHGQGKFVVPDSENVYHGAWINGKPSGSVLNHY